MGITLSQAAILAGKSRKTLYRHIAEGRLSATVAPHTGIHPLVVPQAM